MLRHLALCAVLLTNAAAQSNAPAGAHHDKAYWRAIVKNEFKAPAGDPIAALAGELSQSLGSPDPEMRDDLAYTILTTWIYKTHEVDVPTLRSLVAEWLENLRTVSDPAPDSVLRRSFSALMLSVAAARDNAEPFLDEKQFRNLWQSSLAYLAAETDLRGFDNRLGWVHSAAHTADLLKFLARSRYLSREDQAALLAAVQRKLSIAPVVFAYGEDERYARTVLSLVSRKDFDLDAFDKWAQELGSTLRADFTPSEQALHGRQNLKNFLAKLDFLLSAQAESHAADAAVRGALKNTF